MLDVSEIRTGFGKIRVLEWADGGGGILARIESARRSRRASGFVVWDRSDRKPVPVARIFVSADAKNANFGPEICCFANTKLRKECNLLEMSVG